MMMMMDFLERRRRRERTVWYSKRLEYLVGGGRIPEVA
jgi:hypothetical protein